MALGFLQAYIVPQLLREPAWQPPLSVAVAALLLFILSAVDIILSLFAASMLAGCWACVSLLFYLRRVTAVARTERARAAV